MLALAGRGYREYARAALGGACSAGCPGDEMTRDGDSCTSLQAALQQGSEVSCGNTGPVPRLRLAPPGDRTGDGTCNTRNMRNAACTMLAKHHASRPATLRKLCRLG